MQVKQHPTPDELADFNSGKLSDDQSTVIEEHLDQCDACCQLLKNLPDDTLVSLLRANADTSVSPDRDAGSGGAEAKSRPAPVRVTPPTNGELIRASEDKSAESLAALPAELCEHLRYDVEKLLGRGGMGDVYMAHHRLMNRPVAIKLINANLVNNEAAIARFHREVQTAARLSHPNIVTAYDAEQAGDLQFLVMEFVDGVTLEQLVNQSGPLSVELACNYIRQAAAGLQHAHELGMVHRDIKPHNLMLSASGEVKILDFGLARFASEVAAEANHSLTQSRTTMGTPDYVAPEQIEDAHKADIRADVYSLGCTFYRLLADITPFSGSVLKKIKAHADQEARPLADFRDDVPPEVEAILLKMMAKDPAERFQQPVELVEALRLHADGVIASAVKPIPGKAAKLRRSRSFWTTVTGLLLLLAGGALAGAAAVYRISTDKGELIIKTDDPDVEVVVSRRGELVTIIDLKTKRKFKLKTGEYEVALGEGADGLRLSTQSFTLSRGEERIVEVTRIPAAAETTGLSPLPNPRLVLEAIEHPKPDDPNYTLYRLAVANHAEYPAEFFKPAPDLPPCGSNANSARTWVDVYSSGGRRLNGFCGIYASVGLTTSLVFTVSKGAAHPVAVYVVLHDRRTGVKYKSNAVEIARRPDRGPNAMQLADRIASGTDVIDGFAMSHDGRFVATSNWASGVRVWDFSDVDDAKRIFHRTDTPIHGHMRPMAISAEGSAIVVHGGQNTDKATGKKADFLDLLDVASGETVRRFEGLPAQAGMATFTPDGNNLLTASHKSDWGPVVQWDVATGGKVREFNLPKGNYVQRIVVSPDSRHFAMHFERPRGEAADIVIWNLATGKVARRLPHKGAMSIDFFPDGKQAVTHSPVDGRLQFWNLETGKQTHAAPLAVCGNLFVLPDAHTALVVTNHDQPGSILHLVDLKTGRVLDRVEDDKHIAQYVAITPDGRHAITCGGWYWDSGTNDYVKEDDFQIYVWRLPERVWRKDAADAEANVDDPPEKVDGENQHSPKDGVKPTPPQQEANQCRPDKGLIDAVLT